MRRPRSWRSWATSRGLSATIEDLELLEDLKRDAWLERLAASRGSRMVARGAWYDAMKRMNKFAWSISNRRAAF